MAACSNLFRCAAVWWFAFPFMTQGNGSEACFRRWLRLTAAPLTGINFAGHAAYSGGCR
jgi:hypothetical protein